MELVIYHHNLKIQIILESEEELSARKVCSRLNSTMDTAPACCHEKDLQIFS